MKKIILITVLVLFLGGVLVGGCDYVPRTIYEIKTVDDKIIKLSCPEVDQGRSVLTYFKDGDCIIVKAN